GFQIELVDSDVHRLLCAVANDAHRNGGPGLGRDDHLHQLITAGDGLAVEGKDHIAGFESGLGGGTARRDGLDDRALAILQAELVNGITWDAFDADANAAAGDLAGAQLRKQITHGVDRDREADADVARLTTVRDDGGIEANHFATHVE